nr:hypothetical protein 6 [Alphaproteobacteria bacterium]
MKRKIAGAFAISLALSSLPAVAETVFYCQAELATGFIKRNGGWSTTNFELERYTIKLSDDLTLLYGLDENRPYVCDWAYNDPSKYTLVCLSGYGNGEDFILDLVKNRFVHSSVSPATGYSADRTDTDALIAGRCQQF